MTNILILPDRFFILFCSDLSRHAEDLFGELTIEATNFTDRARLLGERVTSLNARLSLEAQGQKQPPLTNLPNRDIQIDQQVNKKIFKIFLQFLAIFLQFLAIFLQFFFQKLDIICLGCCPEFVATGAKRNLPKSGSAATT